MRSNDQHMRRLLSIVAILIFMIASCGPAAERPELDAPQATVRINDSFNVSSGPIFIALAEGYFDAVNIELDFVTFNRSSEALPLIATGDLDVFASSMSSGLLNALGSEQGVKVVADRTHISSNDECVTFGMIFREDLYESGEMDEPAELAGKRVTYREGGVGDYALQSYLALGGLTVNDLELVSVPTDSIVQAWENGALDVAYTSQPRLTQIQEAGNAVLAVNFADVVGELQLASIVFGKRLTTDERELGIRFLMAYIQGLAQFSEGKTDRNVEILAEYIGDSEENIRNACWPQIDPEGWVDFGASVDGFQQWSIENGYLDEAITEEQYWDSSLLQAAHEALGD